MKQTNLHSHYLAIIDFDSKGRKDQSVALINNLFKLMFLCQSKLQKIPLRERKFQHFTLRKALLSCQK